MLIYRVALATILVSYILPTLGQETVQQQSTVKQAQPEMYKMPKTSSVTQDRQNKLKAAVTTFDELIRRKPPASLTRRQLAEWNEHTKWLESVRDRYQKMHSAYSPVRQSSPTTDTAKLNSQFLALQNAVQMESRKFQTLSNVSKARHDIAMAAIRNTRA